MKIKQLPGFDGSDMVTFQSDHALVSSHFRIHKTVAPHLQQLCEKAAEDGLPLALISGYRSYQRQATIWDEKFSGKREILDENALPVKSFKNDEEKFAAISQWSAVPGTSRHHWGTDMDIFDARSLKQGYRIQLIPEEFSANGPCEKLNFWLIHHLKALGFYRPYLQQNPLSNSASHPPRKLQSSAIKSIPFEPWHISYLPTARKCIQYITEEKLLQTWSSFTFSASNWAKENVETICKFSGF